MLLSPTQTTGSGRNPDASDGLLPTILDHTVSAALFRISRAPPHDYPTCLPLVRVRLWSIDHVALDSEIEKKLEHVDFLIGNLCRWSVEPISVRE